MHCFTAPLEGVKLALYVERSSDPKCRYSADLSLLILIRRLSAR